MRIQTLFIWVIPILFFIQCSTTPKASEPLSKVEIKKEKAVQGGMWIPNEVDAKDMKKMGLELDIDQLFNTQEKGLNRAIAHFNRGCTSEVISPKGLLLTNHHCGYGEIQSHSTVDNNLIDNGYWAYNLSDELPNESTTATFIVDIQEVTQMVNKGLHSSLSDEEMLQLQRENIDFVISSTPVEPYQEVIVKPYFDGNKYYKIISETYPDVRLVGAPPSSIGKFGSDTDNWMWPRHTGDFSLFRIYADKNNKPAPYSPDNVPYTPDRHLKVSLKGVEKDDFTMVYGFPGRTQEYLPSIAVLNITEKKNPAAIATRKIALDILDKKMRKDEATRIQYASKYARISNYYKKWIGENLGIEKTGAIAKKVQYEDVYTRNLNAQPELFSQYGNVLKELNVLHTQQADYLKPDTLFNEIFLRNSETFIMAYLAQQLLAIKGTVNEDKALERVLSIMERRYKVYDSELDKEVSLALADFYQKELPSSYLTDDISKGIQSLESDWSQSAITGNVKINGVSIVEDAQKAFENPKAVFTAFENDPIVQWYTQLLQNYRTKTEEPNKIIQAKIDQLQKKYMEAQMAVYEDKIFYPDANSTLRVTYGKVNSYTNGDGVSYPYQTYLSGVMEKYKPGDYEFDVSQKLQDLYVSKEYGKYGKNGKMPVNFIASNHTTGGNSGSPALDQDGNLIGLNFDRVWEGTMSDLYYDPSICRNIMVDARYILFIIDKYANAKNLIQEIETVE